jgi:hypothetical protein
MMTALESYVNEKNKWRAVFGKEPLSLSNARDRQRLAETIDCDLSPENLTCDGELRGPQLHARHKQLTTAGRQLVLLDPSLQTLIYELN